jgi:hypothetical protein
MPLEQIRTAHNESQMKQSQIRLLCIISRCLDLSCENFQLGMKIRLFSTILTQLCIRLTTLGTKQCREECSHRLRNIVTIAVRFIYIHHKELSIHHDYARSFPIWMKRAPLVQRPRRVSVKTHRPTKSGQLRHSCGVQQRNFRTQHPRIPIM